MTYPRIGLIGAGKVGRTLARLWFSKGVMIPAVYSRTPAHAELLARQVSATVCERVDDVFAQSDLIVIAVTDDAIAQVVGQVSVADLAGKSVVHTSGALDAEVLRPLAERGAQVGSLHPAYPFTDVETALTGIAGAAFGIEAQNELLRAALESLVRVIDGLPLHIETGSKTLYHAAMVFASNYAVVLYAIGERLLIHAGADRMAADAALNGLLSGTLLNLREQGIPNALTGPLTRADVGTVARHLEALSAYDSTLRDLYVELAKQAFPLLQARGIDTAAVNARLGGA